MRLLACVAGVLFCLSIIPSWSESKIIAASEVERFLHDFERLAVQEDFSLLREMVHEEAFFRFSDGDFIGREEVKKAFEKTWASGAAVADEKYYLTDVKVLTTDHNSATATYTYNWEGKYESQPFKITGRGTRVVVKANGSLQIMHEHLSRFPD